MQQEQDGDISLPREDVAAEQSLSSLRKLSIASEREVDIGEEDDGEGDLGAGARDDVAEEVATKPRRKSVVELDTVDLNNDEDATSMPSSDTVTTPPRHHVRTDSVPLQRYTLDPASPQGTRRMVDDDHYVPASHLDRDGLHVSETEDAGLDFVDVHLDNGLSGDAGSGMSTGMSFGAHGTSPYGLGGFAASRSAVEIRQDSISSDSAKARELARMAESMQQQPQQQSYMRPSSSTSTPSDHSRAASEEREQRQQSRRHRPAEGRYRGRHSQANSPATSPTHSRRASLTPQRQTIALGPMPGPSSEASPAITMSFAGDDGDIDETVFMAEEHRPMPPVSHPDEQQEGEEGEHEERQELSEVPLGEASENGRNDAIEKEETRPSHSDSADETAKADEQTAEKDDALAQEGSAITLTDAADKAPKKGDKARRESAQRPSALEQHLSRTRMSNLPPKPKTEDVKHLHDFEAMMRQWRELEARKQQEEHERRNKRDDGLHERMKVWERDILPSWTRARREVRLRKLWWKGVPPNLRGRVWALACGNSQMLPRNLFNKASAEAREARAEGSFPTCDAEAMEADVEDTLPTLRLFQRGTGALHDDLMDVLSAFTMVRLQQKREMNADDDSATYPTGAASLAAMLLMNLSPSETLIALINLIAERPWLRALYSLSASNTTASTPRRRGSRSVGSTPISPTTPLRPSTSSIASTPSSAQRTYPSTAALAGFERVFDTLLADQMPKVYANMQARGVRPSAYVNDWIRTLFVPFLPFDAAARLWDCILLEESDALLFRTGIALVSLLSARLYVPDKDELVSILHGNNRAAIAVWTRVRTGSTVDALQEKRASLNASGANGDDVHAGMPRSASETDTTAQSSVYAPDELVPLDEIYGGQYGITEETLFRALDEQDAWWKDSVLERLLDREVVS